MFSGSYLVTEPFPPVGGSPSLCQGAYGEVGNLELVAPDLTDGLWVFWNNTSAVDLPAGPPSGQWSGGLRFGQGNRFDAVTVLQGSRGPAFLELLARSGPVVHRIIWSPEAFSGQGQLASEACGDPALIELPDGQLHAMIPTEAEIVHLVADPSRYPLLSWNRLESLAVPAASSIALSCLPGELGVIAVARAAMTVTISRWEGSWGQPRQLPSQWGWIAAAQAWGNGFMILAGDRLGRARRLTLDAGGAVVADSLVAELEGLRVEHLATCSTSLRGQQVLAVARCGTRLYCFPVSDEAAGRRGPVPALASRVPWVTGGTVHRW